jgi:putative ABC transport system ATP-binding protein
LGPASFTDPAAGAMPRWLFRKKGISWRKMPPSEPLSAAPLIRVEGVGKTYGARAVLSEVSLVVRPGERLALTGPSGSGKTTLLNCLGGVDRPDAGAIFLADARIDQMDNAALARVRRERIGTIFQFFHLLSTLTVAENVELPLQLLRVPLAERAARVAALLERVGLAGRAAALPSQLSGGEQQRVAIARALVHRPAVVLADEPTGNLDSANGANILALLRELTDEARPALVLVTHSEEAAAICHRRLHLRDGRIVAET